MKKIAALGFPLFAKWYITSKCNLRCTHCYLTDYTEQAELEKILSIVDYLGKKGLHSICLLGGEPLVRNDLEIIVERIASHKMGIKIATNGILATAARSQALVNAGANNFQVSVEGHLAELNDSIRGEGTFSKILNGIAELTSAGAHVSLAITLNKKNHQYLGRFFEFANSTGVQEIKLNAFVPIGTGLGLQNDYLLTQAINTKICEDIAEYSTLYKDIRVIGSAFVKQISLQKTNKNTDYTFGCGAGTTSFIINSDFTVSACDMLVEEDRTDMKINVPEDIERIWKDHILFRKWRGQLDTSNLKSVSSFAGVHNNGCHLAYNVYKENIFLNG